eukprot:m51a1_g3813 hypothetical protein (477) ;mRNA; r:262309-264031
MQTALKAEMATRTFGAGETVLFEEEPILSAPATRVPDESATELQRAAHVIFGSSDDNKEASAWSLIYLALEFVAASEATRTRVLELPAPVSPHPNKRASILAAVQTLRGGCAQARDAVSGRDLFRALVRADAHAVECEAANKVALFERAARIGHSCAPNVIFEISPELTISFRAVRDIHEGELLECSFIGDAELLLPTHRRRAMLLGSRGFLCVCDRCCAPDRSRSVRCPRCKTGLVMPTSQLNLPSCDVRKVLLASQARTEQLEPAALLWAPMDEQLAVADEKSKAPWQCQNEDCRAVFQEDEEPFAKEAATMELVKQMEQKISEADALTDIVPHVEELLGKCEDIFGKYHWSVGCLLYDLNVHLQAIAMGFGSFELLKTAAQAAANYGEWVDRTAPDVPTLVANAQFSVGHVFELSGMFDQAAQWYLRCLKFYETAYPGSPTSRRIQVFLEQSMEAPAANPTEDTKPEEHTAPQ